jgi:hypothetical protein
MSITSTHTHNKTKIAIVIIGHGLHTKGKTHNGGTGKGEEI